MGYEAFRTLLIRKMHITPTPFSGNAAKTRPASEGTELLNSCSPTDKVKLQPSS